MYASMNIPPQTSIEQQTTLTSSKNDIEEKPRILVLRKQEVFVYKANPPEPEGYKAASWTNLLAVSPIDVYIADGGKDLYITIPELPEPHWRESHFTSDIPMKRWCEKAYDSSRAYALRATTPSTDKRVWLGLMFRNREDSFDFEGVLHLYAMQDENTFTKPAVRRDTFTVSPKLHTLVTESEVLNSDDFIKASATFAADLPPARTRKRH